jgi:hypothetical protein
MTNNETAILVTVIVPLWLAVFHYVIPWYVKKKEFDKELHKRLILDNKDLHIQASDNMAKIMKAIKEKN